MKKLLPFEHFCSSPDRSFPAIAKARLKSETVRDILGKTLDKHISADVNIVFFGSIARQEWTAGSDVDWTLLVDGAAKAEHFKISQEIRNTLGSVELDGKKMVDPGSSGVFGTLTFSHDLVHHLGGQSDTNINTTRRILLLLESFALGRAAHRPTLTAILDRYLSDDFRFGEPDRRTRVPRFLLNDIVRFWRTLCVDYGMKRWTDSNENKWALRNIKLRMSRKWLFASGLLMMFACDEQSAPPDTTESTRERTTEKLIKLAGMTPTDIIVEQLDSIGLTKQLASLLRLYDEYLEKLDNEELRNRVSKLTPEEARNSKDFRWFKNQGRELQNILIETFFGGNSPDLTKFTKEYGVF